MSAKPPATNLGAVSTRKIRPGQISAFLSRHFHNGRGGRAKLAISANLVARIVTTATSFSILPVTIRYLGNEGFGLMATISSVVGWLQFSNMGIGLGLQNALTEEAAMGDKEAQRKLLSTAVIALVGIGLGLVVIGAAIFPFVEWLKVFPPSTGRFSDEIPWAVGIVYLGFVSTVILGFVGPLYAARQELHLGSIQSVISGVVALGSTWFVVHQRLGLVGVVAATVGATSLVQWAFAIWTLYFRGIPELRPSFDAFTQAAWKRMFRKGMQFLLLQFCNIIFFQLDAMLITQLLAADQVTPYAIAQKVFLQVGGLFAIVTGSLWAAYGHAKVQGDFAWIRTTHRKIIWLFCAFFGTLSVVMIVAGRPLLSWWVGTGAAPSVALLAAVAFYFCLREWTALHAALLNGLNLIREQIPSMIVTSTIVLCLEVYLVQRFGTVGLAVGGGLGFLFASGWYLTYLTNRAFKRMAVVRSAKAPAC